MGLFVILTNFVLAQNKSFSFQHFGPEDGLSNTNVFAIKQDKNDLVYLATENGIYQFDGYNFNKIKPINMLNYSDIRNIMFDSNNNLVIVNRNSGVYNYNSILNNTNKLPGFNIQNSIDELILDSLYNYSLTEQISLTIQKKKTGEIIEDEIQKKFNNENSNNQAFAIYKTKQNVYVGRTDGLYEIIGGKQRKVNLNKKISVYSITADDSGLIYLGSDNAIYCIKDQKIIKTITISIPRSNVFLNFGNNAHVNKILVDKYQRIWYTMSPDDNLYLNENNKNYDVFDLLGIDKVLINTIYKDTDDNIWIGTFNDGVYFIQNPLFSNVTFTSGRKILPVTSSVFIDKHLVVGTHNGLFIIDKDNLNTQTVVEPDELFGEYVHSIKKEGKRVYYSKYYSSSTSNKGFMINNSLYQFICVPSRLFEVPEKNKSAIIADALGTLFSINNYQNNKFNITDTLISFPDYKIKINCINQQNNKLYVGTSNGLYVYDFKTKKYYKHPNKQFRYNINDITRINSKTYIGSENGISCLEDSIIIQQLGEIRLTAIKKIKYHDKKIWLATLDGLFICDENFNPQLIYNKSNGLLSNSINDISFEDEYCCISTNKGITITKIRDLTNRIKISNKLFVSSIEIDEQLSTFLNSIIQLNSSQNDLKINFSSPLYIKPNKQYYRYRFDNGKWQNLENTQIHLTAIEGGKHFIELVGSYDGINWSKPLIFKIQKEIPFTKSFWFIFIIIALSLTIIVLISYIIIKKIKNNATKKVQEDRQVNLLKHQAMNSLMSPHFIFNSLTSIQNYINSNDSLKASEYLAKFSRLIRMIIEKASTGEITLHEELTRLNYYLELEKERFKGKFNFIIEVDQAINTFETKIPNMIIQPYAENSIIHGILPKHEFGILKISFKKLGDNIITINIEDDGIGYNKAKQNAKAGHKSLGTKTIENILELNTKLTGKKQSVTIIDKSDIHPLEQGTIITISLQID